MAKWIVSEAPGHTLVEGLSGCPLALLDSLHAQLFLLAYDRYRRRVDGYERWRFGLALRTAMLTDLYLTGRLRDVDGWPRATGVFDFGEATRHSYELTVLVKQAIPPIRGMRDVIEAVHRAISDSYTGPYSQ